MCNINHFFKIPIFTPKMPLSVSKCGENLDKIFDFFSSLRNCLTLSSYISRLELLTEKLRALKKWSNNFIYILIFCMNLDCGLVHSRKTIKWSMPTTGMDTVQTREWHTFDVL